MRDTNGSEKLIRFYLLAKWCSLIYVHCQSSFVLWRIRNIAVHGWNRKYYQFVYDVHPSQISFQGSHSTEHSKGKAMINHRVTLIPMFIKKFIAWGLTNYTQTSDTLSIRFRRLQKRVWITSIASILEQNFFWLKELLFVIDYHTI